jgi:hypothetical protein
LPLALLITIQNAVYPAFTPAVGFFLLLSSAYGQFKASKGEI